MQADQWPVVPIVGAGAVGCYFGGMLARSGVRVTLIGRARHMETITRDGPGSPRTDPISIPPPRRSWA
jgi:2-polyprenyl-6-methoxyphenol hydroxylase-like FAD-dependent oxidoreductase